MPLKACFICGETTHRSEQCPKQALDIYQLPASIKLQADAQYERDVARMGGGGTIENEYQSFLKVGGFTGFVDRVCGRVFTSSRICSFSSCVRRTMKGCWRCCLW